MSGLSVAARTSLSWVAAGIGAGLLIALGASRVDPVVALRSE